MAGQDAGDGGSNIDEGTTPKDQPQGDQRSGGDQKQEPADTPDSKTFTQADIDRIVADRVDRERKKYADYNDLKSRAAKLQEIEDAKKSETDKLNDQLAAAQVELQTLRVEKIRQQAGRDAKLDPELWEFITESDPETALEQAKRLAKRTAAPEPPEPARADMRQGARTPAPAGQSANDWIRSMASRTSG